MPPCRKCIRGLGTQVRSHQTQALARCALSDGSSAFQSMRRCSRKQSSTQRRKSASCTRYISQATARVRTMNSWACRSRINTNRFVRISEYHVNHSHRRPTAPLDSIRPHILEYWKQRKTDEQIVALLRSRHINLTLHGIGQDLALSRYWLKLSLFQQSYDF
jgi:hypothetical protein